MSKLPRFMISRNPLAEPGVDYILHTQDPKIIAKVEGHEINAVWWEETDMKPEQLAGLMRRIADWYIQLKSYESKNR